MLDVSLNTSNPFAAQWTQTGDKLCIGHWDITYQGRPLEIGSPHDGGDMGTYGIFSARFPDDPELAEGLGEDEWIAENLIWVSDLLARQGIPIDANHLRWLYRAVNAKDWRCGNCSGGCLDFP